MAKELTEVLTRKGIDVSIFTTSKSIKSEHTYNRNNVKISVFPLSFLSKIWPFYSYELSKALNRQIADFDLLHVHEIWHYPLFAGCREAKKTNVPYLVTAHGTLEPYCLKIKSVRKKLYSTLFAKKILKQAAALHAVSEEEIKNITDFVNNRNVYYIPNGINIEWLENPPDREKIENLYPEIDGRKKILFLGRIHPKKGLDLLAKSFADIVQKRKDVCLLVIGPDNENYRSRIEALLAEKEVLNKTLFTGTLTGDNKLAVISGADIFVLPSYSEGFSMSTLEAMACGLPVVITKKCNFPQVEAAQAGRIINNNVNELTNAVIEILDNPELRNRMGNSGKKLIQNEYTWDKLADRMIDCYQDIISRNKNLLSQNR